MLKPLVPPRLEVADRPGVEAPAGRLQLVDDLHGPDLGGAGDRAAGEDRPDHVDRARPRAGAAPRPWRPGGGPGRSSRPPADRPRGPSRTGRPGPGRCAPGRRSWSARPGPWADAASSAASRAIFLGVAAAGPRPLDRPGDDPVAPGLVEPLGAGARRPPGRPSAGTPRTAPGWSARSRRYRSSGSIAPVRREPLREVDLEDVAGRDVLECPAEPSRDRRRGRSWRQSGPAPRPGSAGAARSPSAGPAARTGTAARRPRVLRRSGPRRRSDDLARLVIDGDRGVVQGHAEVGQPRVASAPSGAAVRSSGARS